MLFVGVLLLLIHELPLSALQSCVGAVPCRKTVPFTGGVNRLPHYVLFHHCIHMSGRLLSRSHCDLALSITCRRRQGWPCHAAPFRYLAPTAAGPRSLFGRCPPMAAHTDARCSPVSPYSGLLPIARVCHRYGEIQPHPTRVPGGGQAPRSLQWLAKAAPRFCTRLVWLSGWCAVTDALASGCSLQQRLRSGCGVIVNPGVPPGILHHPASLGTNELHKVICPHAL